MKRERVTREETDATAMTISHSFARSGFPATVGLRRLALNNNRDEIRTGYGRPGEILLTYHLPREWSVTWAIKHELLGNAPRLNYSRT